MKNLISLLLLLFLTVSCSTPYQSVGFKGGYSDTRLDENSFKIQFNGNGFTSKTRVIDFALLRAAELTLKNGYTYFIISGENQYSDEHYSPESSFDYNGKTYTSNASYTTKPSASNTIICFREKPKGATQIYNAKYIAKDLCKKYDIQLNVKKKNEKQN